ncbi:MAG: hypothetical protein PVI01_02390 [Gemmatimonadales bacterium]
MQRSLGRREAGHDVEQDFVYESQDSHDGAGWVVRVEGKLVASGPSSGALEVALRRWRQRAAE